MRSPLEVLNVNGDLLSGTLPPMPATVLALQAFRCQNQPVLTFSDCHHSKTAETSANSAAASFSNCKTSSMLRSVDALNADLWHAMVQHMPQAGSCCSIFCFQVLAWNSMLASFFLFLSACNHDEIQKSMPFHCFGGFACGTLFGNVRRCKTENCQIAD